MAMLAGPQGPSTDSVGSILSQAGTLAVWPAKGSGLGMRSWLGETAKLARISVRPPAFPARKALPRGNGEGVLVIPGFMTGDSTTARIRTFLDRTGYQAEGWQCGRNFGPRSKPIELLKARVERLADETGGPIAVSGVSLGGVFAREIAKMMPDHIAAVVTMCSPVQWPVPTPLAPFVWALQRWFDPALIADATVSPSMPTQKTLAIYSQSDGIVDWRTCLPADRRDNVTLLEVEGAGHSTIGSNPIAQIAVAHFLSDAFA